MTEEAQSIAWMSNTVLVVDPAWREINPPMAGMRAFRNHREQLEVLTSAAAFDDGRRWLHFSCVGRVTVPSWDQFVRAKEAILGRETKAVLVIAPRSEWVNIHPRCLHLYVCMDGDPLPDFTGGSGSI